MMNFNFRGLLAALCPAVLSLAVTAPTAMADRCPVRQAAEDYRQCVKDFERLVYRSDRMGRDQRRIADALEDQTSRVLSRARRGDWNRLSLEIQKASILQAQVEAVVFGNPACPARAILFPAWQKVLAAQSILIQTLPSPAAASGVSSAGVGLVPVAAAPVIAPPVSVGRVPLGIGFGQPFLGSAGFGQPFLGNAGFGQPFLGNSGFGHADFGDFDRAAGFRRVPSRSFQRSTSAGFDRQFGRGSCGPTGSLSRRSVGGISIGAFLQR
ncbi:MAG: hypothetical protein AAF958_10235 [Planctomycetota bacterium]